MKHYKNKTFLAVIPARGGSRRLYNKNLRKIENKTLIEHSILHGNNSKFISKVCVTSDSPKILKVAKKYKNVFLVKRPKYLSNSIIMPDDAVVHAYKKIKKKYDFIITLQPTSPLRTSKQIDAAITKIVDSSADTLVSVCNSHDFYWEKGKRFYFPKNYKPENRPRSQDFKQFRENGSIYISESSKMLKVKNRIFGNIVIFEMDKWNSIDIDDQNDLKMANYLYKNFSRK